MPVKKCENWPTFGDHMTKVCGLLYSWGGAPCI